MAWALVTPSSRGIGHALTRHLLLTTPASLPIVATSRPHNLSETRHSLLSSLPATVKAEERLDVQACDLSSEDSIRKLSDYCQSRYNNNDNNDNNNNNNNNNKKGKNDDDGGGGGAAHLRLAFCVPGMLGQAERAPEQIDPAIALETLRMNLIAPMLLAKHFIRLLPTKNQIRNMAEGHLPPIRGLNNPNPNNNNTTKSESGSGSPSAILAFMSARVGSITDNRLGGWYGYRCSKAGLNQLVRSLHIQLDRLSGGDAVCVGLHPGTVRTGLSRPFWDRVARRDKLFEPDLAAERLCAVLEGLPGGMMGGRCWDWKGEEVLP